MKKLILQLNIPFCVKRCAYCPQSNCKFDIKVLRTYMEAMVLECKTSAEELKEYEVQAVSIEGGSPALADPADLQLLLRTVKKHFSLAEDAQISLQTMPGDYSRSLMERMRDNGVNFWIFGVPSADMKEHALLGRPHSYESLSMVDVAIRTFDVHKRSFEILYGLPGQTAHSWQHTLDSVLTYAPEHLTLRPLQLYPGTELYRRCQRGELTVCQKEERDALYRQAYALLTALGYEAYTENDFALPGAKNRYLLEQRRGTEQLGIGYQAVTRMDGLTYTNGHSLHEYLEHPDEPAVLANNIAQL